VGNEGLEEVRKEKRKRGCSQSLDTLFCNRRLQALLLSHLNLFVFFLNN